MARYLNLHLDEAYQALLMANAGKTSVSKPRRDVCQVFYLLGTGHEICVFDDAGEWDYIEEIKCPDGQILAFRHICEHEGLNNWRPNFEVFEWVKFPA